MMEELQTGKLGLLNKVTDTQAIQQGIGAVGSGAAGFINYPRLGLSYISFCCEKPALASTPVRQALAWCMDRDQLTRDYCQNFGMVVNGYYGIEQWEYLLVSGAMAYPVNFLDQVYPSIDLIEDEDEKAENKQQAYLVHVVDQDGKPVEGVTVNYCTDVSCVPKESDENGLITFTGAPDAYHVTIVDAPDGYSWDEGYEMYTAREYGEWVLRVKKD